MTYLDNVQRQGGGFAVGMVPTVTVFAVSQIVRVPPGVVMLATTPAMGAVAAYAMSRSDDDKVCNAVKGAVGATLANVLVGAISS